MSSITCWCCANIDREEVQHFHNFVVDHAPHITVKDMVTQFLDIYPDLDTRESITNHLENHFIHPSLQVADTIRSLIQLGHQIKKTTTAIDETDGSLVVDTRGVQTYLKVVNELIGVYKNTDPKKMLFGTCTQ